MLKRTIAFLIASLSVYVQAGPFDDVFYLYGNSASAPGIYSNRGRGHSGGTEVIRSSDVMSGFFVGGYNSASFTSPRASIQVLASEDWSTTANGTRFIIQTTSPTLTTPSTAFTVDGTSVTVGVPFFVPGRNSGPRTNAVIPPIAGTIIFNTTGREFCYSTGTLSTQWALLQSSTTACSN